MTTDNTRPETESDTINRRRLLAGAGAAAGAALVPVPSAAILRRNGWMLAPEDL